MISSPLYLSLMERLRGVVRGEFDCVLPDEMNEKKIFRSESVVDGGANFAKTTCRRRDLQLV